MIKIEHLRKEYEDVVPLEDVSVEIHDGDVISVIGPSGTGKSTLLRCINLLDEPTSGHIYIDDEEITAPDCDINRIRQRLGMVFQNFNLFNHLTIIENIMLSPVKLKGLSRQEAYDKSMELLRLV
ncbi:MAG: amino acid ABC transporter ATP-binding protein, partial [Erysipelotrichaceae bacterium]|nr:amino acid ABC transporter ATP-binding protein [Erysipelotrichaceae bacterium]